MRLTVKKLSIGEAVTTGSAILLFVFMFLPWYGLGSQETNLLGLLTPYVDDGNAWQTLELIPLVLLLAITVPIGVALLRLSGLGWWSPIPPGVLTCGGGMLAALAILARIVFPVDLGARFGLDDFPTVLEAGIFLALAAACGIAVGGFLAMREEVASWAGLLARQRRAGEEEEPGYEDEAGQ